MKHESVGYLDKFCHPIDIMFKVFLLWGLKIIILCPVCRTQAEDITRPGFDGFGVRCGEHGDFEVTDTVRAILGNAGLEQWADAFAKAKRSTPEGELLRIDSYKL
jgi:hypothetical protein